MMPELAASINLSRSIGSIPHYLTRPARLLRTYDSTNLRQDAVAGITVAVILLPQAIAFALIAELPPAMGLYTAIVAAIFGALWGSSNQVHTGPTNAISLLVASTLLVGFAADTGEYILAAGLLAVMVGVLQLVMGLARLGMLVNFVSHSVIVGFATGAGVLIAIRQIPSLVGLEVEAEGIIALLAGIAERLAELDEATMLLGVGAIVLIVLLRRIRRRMPAALIAMIIASIIVAVFRLDQEGVAVIGELPRGLPPLARLPIFNIDFIARLSTGALAVGAIGLVETMAIARSVATQTGQRLDSNQEFVGQGLANIASGFLSGYPAAGSFSRTAVNFNAGARTPLAALFSSAFVLVALFVLAPLAAYLPRAALSGVLIVVAIGMIDRAEIVRIWQGARGDAVIMLVTFLGTIFLDVDFAVLAGILLSFARYIMRTSTPRVHQVVPDREFDHFAYRPDMPSCPQLGVVDILGDLYFGAVNHVEEAILQHMEAHPEQRYLLVRMHNVNNCDFSGIHMLENVMRIYRENGGDLFMVRVGYRVDKVMASTGFVQNLGEDHFLNSDRAINYIFHRVLDPAICIYECPVRVFKECQNLPKQVFFEEFDTLDDSFRLMPVPEVSPKELWQALRSDNGAISVVDVREPREFQQGHIPGAELVPLPKILSGEHAFASAGEHRLIFVCRSGRRSRRAALKVAGNDVRAEIVAGGMLAWEAADLLEAVE
ncbi:MAG: sulfate permease [Candidatus Promineifilaceae bacterium]|nr:sulfate permease [Candidatus Promineifilaceae bacterium]